MSEDSRGAASVDKKVKKKKKSAVLKAETQVEEVPAESAPAATEKKLKKKRKSIENDEKPAGTANGNAASRKSERAKYSTGNAATAEVASEDASRKKKKRKQSAGNDAVETSVKPATADPAQVDDDERRSAQREIQQLVTRLRAEGKSKHEIEAAKFDLKKGFGTSFRKPDNSRAKKTEAWKQRQNAEAEARLKKEAATKPVSEKSKEEKEDSSKASEGLTPVAEKSKGEERKEAKGEGKGKSKGEVDPWKEAKREGLEHKHDIVVIPVTWRGRHDEQEIEKAAVDIKACLAQQGLDVWVDSRRHYTPGQKFAHWEFRGVMLRIEVGPDDFNAGMLKLCRAKEAGDYKSVEKKRLRLPPRGSRKLLLQLKEWGLTQIDIERRPADDQESDEEETPAGAGKDGTSKEDDDIGGNWKPRKPIEEEPKKKKKRSA